MFGRIRGMIGWHRLLKDYLVERSEDFPLLYKVEAIESALFSNLNDDNSIRHIVQMLIETHKEFSIANRAKLNVYLEPFGFFINKKGFVEITTPRDFFQDAIRHMILAIKKSKFFTATVSRSNKVVSLPTYKYYLQQSYKHFLRGNWDDMSIQLRKILEFLIVDSSKWLNLKDQKNIKTKKN